jgi:homocysteine S-methyltransferase
MGPRPFLTDGGIASTLRRLEDVTAPHDAVVTLLDDPVGERAVQDAYRSYGLLSREFGTGLVLDTPTRRASADWGEVLGLSSGRLARLNARAVTVLHEVRSRYEQTHNPIVISGAIGPRPGGDQLSSAEAQRYHSLQVAWLEAAGVDLITAVGIERPSEAVGIVRAAASVGLPVAVSFSVDRLVRLPNGSPLAAVITDVDGSTDAHAAYFAMACSSATLTSVCDVPQRLRAIRVEVDDDDPRRFADGVVTFATRHPGVTILGGGDGTDERHIAEIAAAIGRPRRTDAPRAARSRRGHR